MPGPVQEWTEAVNTVQKMAAENGIGSELDVARELQFNYAESREIISNPSEAVRNAVGLTARTIEGQAEANAWQEEQRVMEQVQRNEHAEATESMEWSTGAELSQNYDEVRSLVENVEQMQEVQGRFMINMGGAFPPDALQYPQEIRELQERVEELTGKPYMEAQRAISWDRVAEQGYQEVVKAPEWSAVKGFPQLTEAAKRVRQEAEERIDTVSFVEGVQAKHPALSHGEVATAYSAGVDSGIDDKYSQMRQEMRQESYEIGQELGSNLDSDVSTLSAGREPHSLVLEDVVRGKQDAERDHEIAQLAAELVIREEQDNKQLGMAIGV